MKEGVYRLKCDRKRSVSVEIGVVQFVQVVVHGRSSGHSWETGERNLTIHILNVTSIDAIVLMSSVVRR
jgi:hypothetical protein